MAVAGAALLAGSFTYAAPAGASVGSAEQEFVDLANAEREREGLSPLRVNTDLRGVARDWSDHMADCTRAKERYECLLHNPDYADQVSSRATDDWKRVGENVGYTIRTGWSTSALVERLHGALMDSAGHRRNILGDYNQIGVGVTVADDGSLWVTQNFMKAPATSATQVESSDTDWVDVSDKAVPITGDWNGDGRQTPGWYDEGRVLLRNSHRRGAPDITFSFGRAGDVPIVGDWNGNGKDTIGVLRDGRWYLRDKHKGGRADHEFKYGRLGSGDYALAGDWDGDGRDTIGIVRGGQWHLRDKLAGGHADRVFKYGRVIRGDVPFTGDWNSDGRDTPGIVRGSEWHLRHVNRAGHADRVFKYGKSSDEPVVGDWNGRGSTTPGIVRDSEWHLRNRNAGGGADLTYEY